MKIAFLCYSFIPRLGGAQIFSYNLIKNLIEDGHEVDLYLPHRASTLFNKLYPNSFISAKSIFRYENKLASVFPGILRKKIKYYQKLKQYDLWQVVGAYPAGWVAKDLASKVPIVLRSHGDDIQKNASLQYGLALNPAINQRISKTLNKVTHLVALTRTVEKCYIDFGVPRSKITEIHNGVSIDNFNHIVNVKKERRKLDIGENQIFILSVGRYHKKKGYEILPDTLNILKNEGFDIKWVIVGKLVNCLKEKFQILGLEDNNILIEEIGSGSQSLSNLSFPPNELIKLYKSADIFVMPSLLETFGMVLLEAMASKLPIVTTNAPGCRYVVQHGKNGIIVPTSDPIALSKAIKVIIRDKKLKSKLVSNAYKCAQDHDWAQITEQYLRLYDNILYNK